MVLVESTVSRERGRSTYIRSCANDHISLLNVVNRRAHVPVAIPFPIALNSCVKISLCTTQGTFPNPRAYEQQKTIIDSRARYAHAPASAGLWSEEGMKRNARPRRNIPRTMPRRVWRRRVRRPTWSIRRRAMMVQMLWTRFSAMEGGRMRRNAQVGEGDAECEDDWVGEVSRFEDAAAVVDERVCLRRQLRRREEGKEGRTESRRLLRRLQRTSHDQRLSIRVIPPQLLHQSLLDARQSSLRNQRDPITVHEQFRLDSLDAALDLRLARERVDELECCSSGRDPVVENQVARGFGEGEGEKKLGEGGEGTETRHPAPAVRDREEDGVDDVGEDLTCRYRG